MKPTKLLLLPPLATSPAVCLAIDPAGTIVARETLAADAPAGRPPEPCVLAVPAAEVGLHRLRLRARSQAQALAAAARLVQNQLALPHGLLHFAVSTASGDEDRWVAVVDPARMRDWLDRATRHGFLPTAMVPDCLLLAAPEGDGFRVCETDASWRVRGAAIAFSAEPDLARAMLDAKNATGQRLLAATEADLARGAVLAAPVIDLMQQGFSLHPVAPTGWAAWRPVAILAAVGLALLPLGHGALALRHELGVRSIHASAATQLQAVAQFPGAQGSPFARAEAALAAARARDAFAITTGALFEALAQIPTAGVAQLDFGEDSVLAVSIDHDQAIDLEQLTTLLAERGVSAALDTTQASGGRLRSTLLLGVAP